ncbi:hypothetical protein SG34_012165 [Thalassomonas viridans]|uniref:Phosphoenolpyruvate carboxylase n=1 Tax=Thalassomonas viridans TaxID=137584 RepID=A0AAE9Z7B4_9GAMM|nr:hypothetical protein [Thalassomonas viridans]WDE07567.1 hypothetical protein SG34_012165 [Thalassomonas viridans]
MSKVLNGKDSGQQSPQSRLQALGVERLSLLGKYAQPLMQTYISGHFDETSVSEQALEKLIKARLLWRPDEQEALCLRPGVNGLIASLTEDERKRQINADIAGQLDQIRTRVTHYQDAQYRGDYAASEHHFQLLTEKVHDMTGQFSDAIASLWNRLNSDFGFVSNLADKIRENELAQKQLRRLLDGFELIDFNEMIELAQSNGALRKLLVSQLQVSISDHASSLLEVQKRLVELMARFRQQQERVQLIASMSAFLKQHPNFRVGDYANRSKVPELVNRAKPIIANAAIGLDRSGDTEILAELVREIPVEQQKVVEMPQSGGEFELADESLLKAREQALKEDVENFFIAILDTAQGENRGLSALEYLQQKQLAWDGEIWLFQVIAEFEGLASEFRRSFTLEKCTRELDPFNQVDIIYDLKLGVNQGLVLK